MADFCKQCADEMGFPTDLDKLCTPEETAKKLYPVVLCEGCGPIEVDHEGNCMTETCIGHHRKGTQQGIQHA